MRERAISTRRFEAPGRPTDALVRKGMARVGPTMSIPSLLREHGVDPGPLLAEFDLTPGHFDEPENVISVTTRYRLLHRCAEATQCPHFGLMVGQRAGISAFGALGFLMQSAPDVRTALDIGAHHIGLQNPTSTAQLYEDDSFASVKLAFLDSGIQGRAEMLEAGIATTFNVIRALCGHHWQPAEVQISHARPRDVAPFRQFFQAPLVFDAAETGLVFDGRWLDRPLASADPQLHLMMKQRVIELESLARDDPAGQLWRILPSLVHARSATLEVAAKRLGFGARTLNRRLAAAGTSFMQLREEARYSIARQLLQDTGIPVGRIADHLGYANASAFTAAFRRWSGMAPAPWRATCSTARRPRGG